MQLYIFFLENDSSARPKNQIQSQVQVDHERKAILYDASEQLCIEFSKFVNRTIHRLNQRVTAESLSTFVLTTMNCLGMDYPADLANKLTTCKEAGDILRELTHKDCHVIVFHNIDILELIIQEYFGEADEDLKHYNVKFDEYLRRRICEHHLFQPKDVGKEVISVSESAKVYIFMDGTWTKDTCLRKLYKLEKRLARVLQCRHIQLTEIRLGSLCFCYHILEKCDTHSELYHEQVLRLINFGVKDMLKETNGREYLIQMEKICKNNYTFCFIKFCIDLIVIMPLFITLTILHRCKLFGKHDGAIVALTLTM